jgi:hypothetical protein
MANTLTKQRPGIAGDGRRREGPVARTIESQTAKLPSDVFLWGATAVMATSLTLQLMGKKHTSLFIGQWAAPILLFGLYNKVVKTTGHDQYNSGEDDSDEEE